MSDLLTYIFFIACIIGRPIAGKISDQRLCGDPTCSDPVSLAKTLIRYNSDDARILSFPSNVEVKVFSKSAGTREDLWGVEIGGKRGYVSKNLLREYKVLKRNLEFVIPTENNETNDLKTEPISDEPNSADATPNVGSPSVALSGVSAESTIPDTAPLPNEIRRPYEVHDGTTFYITPSGNDEPPPPPIQASTTDASTKASAVDLLPVQVDVPNASMLLPSPATSSNEMEPHDPVVEEQEGSAIYNYISSFLPGDGNGSKESASESSGEYEDDEDYDEDEDLSEENLRSENGEVGRSEEVPASVSIGSDEVADSNPIVSEEIQLSDEFTDINPIISEEVSNNNLTENHAHHFVDKTSAPQIEAQVSENSKNRVETNVSGPSEFSGEKFDVIEVMNKDRFSIIGQEKLSSSQDDAKVIDSTEFKHETNNIEEGNNSEVTEEVSHESVNSNIASSHEDEGSQELNDVQSNEIVPPSIDLPSNSNVESPDVDQTHSVDIKVNSNSEPELMRAGTDERIVSAGDTGVDSTERLPETVVQDLEINHEPTVGSIFDLNRHISSEETVATEVPDTTDSSVEELRHSENIELKTVIPEHISSIPEQIAAIPEQTAAIPEQTAAIPEQTAAIPEHTTVIPEHTPQANDIDFVQNSTTGTEGELDMLLEKNNTIISSAPANEVSESSGKETINDSSENLVESESGTSFFSTITDLLYSIPNVFTSTSPSPNPEDLRVDETEPHIDQAVEIEAVQEIDKHTDTLPVWLASNTAAASSCEDEMAAETDRTYSILPSSSKVVDDMIAVQDFERSGPAVSLIITAITVLLFTLGYYLIEKSRRDSSFIAKINSLERSLFVTTKECQLVKDDLETTKGMLIEEHTSLASNETRTDVLYAELEELRLAAIEYEEQIQSLQLELDAATDTGLEVNRMLTEVLTQNGSANTLFESFDTLQSQLKEQQKKIIKMSDQLKNKTSEAEDLTGKLAVSEEKCFNLQQDLDALNKSFNDMFSKKRIEDAAREQEIKDYLSEIDSLKKKFIEQGDASFNSVRRLDAKLGEMETVLTRRDLELETMKEMWKKVIVKDDSREGHINAKDVRLLVNVSRVKAELTMVKRELETVTEKLSEEQGAKAILDDHMHLVDQEMMQLRRDCTTAETTAAAAEQKLGVLTKYFEDREAALQSELEKQVSVFNNATGQRGDIEVAVATITKQNKALEDQNKALRQEITEQERQRKEQMRGLEAKYNEAWLMIKQLERKLEESKQDSAQLRNRLTIAEGAQSSTEQTNGGDSRLTGGDLNGELLASPLHMGLADLPIFPPFVSPHLGGGIPFMPPPSYPQDRRPPPLGCMSSPPLLPPPPPQHFGRHYDRPDSHSPDRPTFRGGRQAGPAGFRPLPPTAKKNKDSTTSSTHSSESLDQSSNQHA